MFTQWVRVPVRGKRASIQGSMSGQKRSRSGMWLASRHRFVVVNLRFAVPPPRGCTVGDLFGGAQEEELKSPDCLVRGRRPTGRTGGRVSGVAPRGPRRCAVRPYWLLHSRNTSVAPPTSVGLATSVGLVVQHRIPRMRFLLSAMAHFGGLVPHRGIRRRCGAITIRGNTCRWNQQGDQKQSLSLNKNQCP